MLLADYHMPLFRPPSEGENLIIQATWGCSFNRCTFCSMYSTKTYRLRPLDEIFAHMEAAVRDWPDARRVFIADGDALVMPMDHWRAILDRLEALLPDLNRVTCYATPAALLKKTPEELTELRERRMSLVYMGIESGAPDILRRIRKGASQDGMARAMDRAHAAGIRVSATVILGLGGQNRWRDHIDGTADLINRAPPTFLSTLQLHLADDARARFMQEFGEPFTEQDDLAILEEQARFIQRLDPPRPVIFRSNHASNALPLAGTLPRDRDRLLSLLAAACQGRAPLRPRWIRGL